MNLGLAYCLLLCFIIGLVVSERRERVETKGVIGQALASSLSRIRWTRWNWSWGKRRLNQRQTAEEMLADVFHVLDKDKDGFIDMDELDEDYDTLLKGKTNGNTKKPKDLMEQSDTNRDGFIDFKEFRKHLGPDNGTM